jgi:hypothetical protein
MVTHDSEVRGIWRMTGGYEITERQLHTVTIKQKERNLYSTCSTSCTNAANSAAICTTHHAHWLSIRVIGLQHSSPASLHFTCTSHHHHPGTQIHSSLPHLFVALLRHPLLQSFLFLNTLCYHDPHASLLYYVNGTPDHPWNPRAS